MTRVTASRALSIGEMARRSGVNIETIRYYERIGVMPAPARTAGSHRSYDTGQLKRLVFIRRSRELGFSLNDIRSLLDLVDRGDYSCGEVHAMAVAHLGSVRAKIADLRHMEHVLADMAAQCSQGEKPECPIVDSLFERLDAPAAGRQAKRS